MSEDIEAPQSVWLAGWGVGCSARHRSILLHWHTVQDVVQLLQECIHAHPSSVRDSL